MTFKILVVKADERDLEDTCAMLQAISDEHDDPAPRAALTPFLEVHRARNGEDAWEMAMATDYDVAFVDTEVRHPSHSPRTSPATCPAPRRSAPPPPVAAAGYQRVSVLVVLHRAPDGHERGWLEGGLPRARRAADRHAAAADHAATTAPVHHDRVRGGHDRG